MVNKPDVIRCVSHCIKKIAFEAVEVFHSQSKVDFGGKLGCLAVHLGCPLLFFLRWCLACEHSQRLIKRTA